MCCWMAAARIDYAWNRHMAKSARVSVGHRMVMLTASIDNKETRAKDHPEDSMWCSIMTNKHRRCSTADRIVMNLTNVGDDNSLDSHRSSDSSQVVNNHRSNDASTLHRRWTDACSS